MGPAGGEILGFLAVAVHAEVPVDTLRTMIYAYPTFHRAIESALGRPLVSVTEHGAARPTTATGSTGSPAPVWSRTASSTS